MLKYYHDDGALVPGPSSVSKPKETKSLTPYINALVPFLSRPHALKKVSALLLAILLVGGGFTVKKFVDTPTALGAARSVGASVIEIAQYLTLDVYVSGARRYAGEMTKLVSGSYKDVAETLVLAYQSFATRLSSIGLNLVIGPTARVANVVVSTQKSPEPPRELSKKSFSVSFLDEQSGEPYCVKVVEGKTTTTAGVCEVSGATASPAPSGR